MNALVYGHIQSCKTLIQNGMKVYFIEKDYIQLLNKISKIDLELDEEIANDNLTLKQKEKFLNNIVATNGEDVNFSVGDVIIDKDGNVKSRGSLSQQVSELLETEM